MAAYLTEDEYATLQSRINAGVAEISIPRGVARQFFTHVSNSSIKSITDSSMLLEKTLIWIVIIFSILSFLAASALTIKSFGYWSAVAVPLIGIFWAVLAGLTFEEGSWPGMTIILAISFAGIFFMVRDYSVPFFFFVLSIWTYRITYIVAQRMLTSLVMESYAAFDMLVEHVEIEESDSASAN